MTLTQLRAFVAVARLGSVKAAALSLRVSEPAVSSAVAALRRELGDQLFVRAAGGIALTPGGRRLAAGAAEIVGLAEDTCRRVREAGSGSVSLRVATTETSAEQILPPLLEAFLRRRPEIESTTLAVPAALLDQVLLDRRADVAIGATTGEPAADDVVERFPFLRFQLAVVAAPAYLGLRPGAPAERPRLPESRLPRERWLLGPGGLDPGTPGGAFLARHGVGDSCTSIFPSATAALNAAVAGDGLSVSLVHLVRDQLRQGALTLVDVPGLPVNGMLYAGALRGARRSPAASALCGFVTTPAALESLLTRATGVPVGHYRPTVHVTLWS
ncbi:LysR family transcriptional regulator [Streptacidiphilus sp. PB12-B1b]|uniref:LysR family transcriptional regulator n=1 Tax=Streptacidiphilus sp. PB12-B1b TaxID=2705012 RepID=UPI0015FE56C9|nr:LysR family transcriptional regulator [Streptacidiphilus sp. PB12-B1b]QMU77859.1 LysR family transcriptional regulator [Streptacidiphilus sp. PB12-B1b]